MPFRCYDYSLHNLKILNPLGEARCTFLQTEITFYLRRLYYYIKGFQLIAKFEYFIVENSFY